MDFLIAVLCVLVAVILFCIIVSIGEREWGRVVLLCVWSGFLIWAIVVMGQEKKKPQTIHCKSIEQIDTLYRNDSIVGYELIIIEERK